jgi:hypothetical protein
VDEVRRSARSSSKDVNGEVAAELGGGRGGPVTITDITMPAGDLILKFKQMGRGGEVEVMMALTLKDGGLTVKQTINGMDTTGTGCQERRVRRQAARTRPPLAVGRVLGRPQGKQSAWSTARPHRASQSRHSSGKTQPLVSARR